MTPNMTFLERGKTRKAFVRENMNRLTIEELAAEIGTTTTTVRDYIARINKQDKQNR